jgi:ABC-2 type transport system ATP-binding protein
MNIAPVPSPVSRFPSIASTVPSIATHALTRKYGSHTALEDVTLSVEPGSVYALVGPNGAGKTTLIQLIMNLQAATSGTAEVLGVPSRQIRGAALNRIGYVSESQEIPDWMTIEIFLNYLRPFYPTWDRALEKQLLADFGLPLDRKLKHLSRGMRMKAAFIGALSYRPALLVLDEPFSGLDPVNAEVILAALRALQRAGTTLILSSHHMWQIEDLCERFCIIAQGEVRAAGTLAELRAAWSTRVVEVEPSTAALRAVLDATPSTHPLDTDGRPTLAYEVDIEVDTATLLRRLVAAGDVTRFARIEPSLHDIYLRAIGAVA